MPLPPRNPGPACDRVLRLWQFLRIGGLAADALPVIRRLRISVCYKEIENRDKFIGLATVLRLRERQFLAHPVLAYFPVPWGLCPPPPGIFRFRPMA